MDNTSKKIIELGGGSNPMFRPNVDARMCYDSAGNRTVDFTCNFDEILPIASNEWEGVFCRFVIEHLSWRCVKQFLSETFRILKENGEIQIITANVDAQLEWIKNNPDGWDDKNAFESFSCVLFGDQTYPENAHKNYMNPNLLIGLMREVGYENITVAPFGDRKTDMHVTAKKPIRVGDKKIVIVEGSNPLKEKVDLTIENKIVDQMVAGVDYQSTKNPFETWAKKPIEMDFTGDNSKLKDELEITIEKKEVPREEMFDKHYFNGGKKFGGYMREGYWDYPIHEVTARHILNRKPESVLELACARGYVLKRIQDAGVYGAGIEISKHCYMTRVCENIERMDVCEDYWFPEKNCVYLDNHLPVDLLYSVAFMEHVPEKYLNHVIGQMARYSKRGLHGIDFGEKDDGMDKTHCTLKPKSWWQEQFAKYAPNWPVEIVDKEELERGEFPQEILKGDGKLKLNIGSHTVMFHHGWVNMDVSDLKSFAEAYGYQYHRHDIRNGIPYNTGSVSLINCSHMIEHLTYDEGLKFLKECRRVLKEGGVIRIAVPDSELLLEKYQSGTLDYFIEINDEIAKTSSNVKKLHSLLYAGHQSTYDKDILCEAFENAGFSVYYVSRFRKSASEQILKECIDMFPCLSCYVEASVK